MQELTPLYCEMVVLGMVLNMVKTCYQQGESVWVRDYWPNTAHNCKWTKVVIESVDGPLNYSVLLDNGHSG